MTRNAQQVVMRRDRRAGGWVKKDDAAARGTMGKTKAKPAKAPSAKGDTEAAAAAEERALMLAPAIASVADDGACMPPDYGAAKRRFGHAGGGKQPRTLKRVCLYRDLIFTVPDALSRAERRAWIEFARRRGFEQAFHREVRDADRRGARCGADFLVGRSLLCPVLLGPSPLSASDGELFAASGRPFRPDASDAVEPLREHRTAPDV